MSITLIADEETAGTLAGKLSQDPFFLSEGPVERAAFILFYDSIIQCDLKARTATLTYHLGDDSEAWRFNDDNFRELLAVLAP